MLCYCYWCVRHIHTLVTTEENHHQQHRLDFQLVHFTMIKLIWSVHCFQFQSHTSNSHTSVNSVCFGGVKQTLLWMEVRRSDWLSLNIAPQFFPRFDVFFFLFLFGECFLSFGCLSYFPSNPKHFVLFFGSRKFAIVSHPSDNCATRKVKTIQSDWTKICS